MKLSQKYKSRIAFLFFGVFISCINLNAQIIKSIEAYSDYSVALNRFGSPKQYINSDLKVTRAEAFGGGVKANFKVSGPYYLGISFGYQLFSIDQDSSLEKWNWMFWDVRYKGIVSSLKTDPSLSGILRPIQKLDYMPLFFSLNAEYKPVPQLSINPSVGVGVAFYTRRLYLEETWQKKFDQLNYTFGYTYRNFAPNKTGNPFGFSAGANIAYEFAEGFRLHSELNYVQFIKTPGSAGSDSFPIERIINIKLGLTFLY